MNAETMAPTFSCLVKNNSLHRSKYDSWANLPPNMKGRTAVTRSVSVTAVILASTNLRSLAESFLNTSRTKLVVC